jgi:hypothetical protein
MLKHVKLRDRAAAACGCRRLLLLHATPTRSDARERAKERTAITQRQHAPVLHK